MSISVFLLQAKAHHKTNINQSFLSERCCIVASVNFSQPIFEWDIGSDCLTVNDEFNIKTHCSAHFCKHPLFGGLIHKSSSNSLKIFCNDGGNLTPGWTEKHSQCACHGWWYGSCHNKTTFTLSNGVVLYALKIFFHSGYIIFHPLFSLCKVSFISKKYGFWNSSHNSFFHDSSIWGSIILMENINKYKVGRNWTYYTWLRRPLLYRWATTLRQFHNKKKNFFINQKSIFPWFTKKIPYTKLQ